MNASRLLRWGALCAAAGLLAAHALGGQFRGDDPAEGAPRGLYAPAGVPGTPQGGQFQVNTYTTNSQAFPHVAMDPEGRFVVVWQSAGSYGTDTSGNSIQVRRYAADGIPLDDELQVNSYTTGSQLWPAVAMDVQGRFVVVWQSEGSSGTDTDGFSIQAQLYDAAGDTLGGEFQVNTYTTGFQGLPAVAMSPAGRFVIVWSSEGSSGTDTSGQSIQARVYAPDGSPVGGQFQVNNYTTSNQIQPAVAMNADGNFVVVWKSFGSSGTDHSLDSIQAQRFFLDGAPVGFQFQVNTYTTGGQERPAVAMDAQGGFVVVWESAGSDGTDASDLSVQARRFAATGAALGDDFQVNTYTTGYQYRPKVAMDDLGSFVVAWQSFGSSGTDTSYDSIQAQLYDTAGAALGDELQVNTFTTSFQNLPAAAMDAQGNFVVAWSSNGSSGTDQHASSIQAQRYGNIVFRDGFETGTNRWSAVAP